MKEAGIMYCKKCGKEVNEGSIFCKNCGTPIKSGSKEITTIKNKNNNSPQKAMLALELTARIINAVGYTIIIWSIYWWAAPTLFLNLGKLFDLVTCLFSSARKCAIIFDTFAAGADISHYDPILFWIGIVVSFAGLVMRITIKIGTGEVDKKQLLKMLRTKWPILLIIGLTISLLSFLYAFLKFS